MSLTQLVAGSIVAVVAALVASSFFQSNLPGSVPKSSVVNPNAPSKSGIPELDQLHDFMGLTPGLTSALKEAKQSNTPYGMTSRKDLEGLKALLAAGADPNAYERDVTALYVSGKGGVEFARALLDAGAEVDRGSKAGTTPLQNVIVNAKNTAIANLLLDRGASCTVVNKDKRTLAYLASLNGNVDLIKRVIACGADVNAVDFNNENVLFPASREFFPAAVEYLLSLGINPHHKDINGLTALDRVRAHPLYEHKGEVGREVERILAEAMEKTPQQ